MKGNTWQPLPVLKLQLRVNIFSHVYQSFVFLLCCVFGFFLVCFTFNIYLFSHFKKIPLYKMINNKNMLKIFLSICQLSYNCGFSVLDET